MTYILASIAPAIIGFAAGYWTRARQAVGKRQADGFAGSDDWSFPGRPIIVTDAEFEDTLRKSEGAR